MSHNMVKLDKKCFVIMAPFYTEHVNYKFPAGSYMYEPERCTKVVKNELEPEV